jgi:PIN domain nuclease of toxin-antitoxin system
MTILLDTHVILWWLDDDPRLGSKARDVIGSGDVQLLVSIASLWEVSIKHRIGKLRANAALVASHLREASISVLPVKITHLTALEQLPLHHRDPFDRMLVAQALAETVSIMTNDALVRQYGLPCIDAAR